MENIGFDSFLRLPNWVVFELQNDLQNDLKKGPPKGVKNDYFGSQEASPNKNQQKSTKINKNQQQFTKIKKNQ